MTGRKILSEVGDFLRATEKHKMDISSGIKSYDGLMIVYDVACTPKNPF